MIWLNNSKKIFPPAVGFVSTTNRNDLNFERTSHLDWACVLHLEEWQHVRRAKLIPWVSLKWRCLQPVTSVFTVPCVPSILDVTMNIFLYLMESLVRFFWVSHWLCSPIESCDRQSIFQEITFQCTRAHYCDGVFMLEHNCFWNSWRSSLCIFLKKKMWRVIFTHLSLY